MTEHATRVAVAERAARAGAQVALEKFRTALAVDTKANKTDVVTQADRDAQARVVEVVRDAFPGETVVGEEAGTADEVPPSGPAWVVDPVDGTNNFVRGNPAWCTSVAAVVDGETVGAANVAPALGDAYVADADGLRLDGDPVNASERTDPETCHVGLTLWWEFDDREAFAAACRGVVSRFGDLRRVGSAQLTLSMVAAGQLDGALGLVPVSPWDSLAGAFMVRRGGGRVTDAAGDRWEREADCFVAGPPPIHGDLRATAAEYFES